MSAPKGDPERARSSLHSRPRPVGNPTLNIGIFLAFVVFTLGIVIKVAGGKKTAEQYYTGGRRLLRSPERHRHRR
jgi:hypothetical protein